MNEQVYFSQGQGRQYHLHAKALVRDALGRKFCAGDVPVGVEVWDDGEDPRYRDTYIGVRIASSS